MEIILLLFLGGGRFKKALYARRIFEKFSLLLARMPSNLKE